MHVKGTSIPKWNTVRLEYRILHTWVKVAVAVSVWSSLGHVRGSNRKYSLVWLIRDNEVICRKRNWAELICYFRCNTFFPKFSSYLNVWYSVYSGIHRQLIYLYISLYYQILPIYLNVKLYYLIIYYPANLMTFILGNNML